MRTSTKTFEVVKQVKDTSKETDAQIIERIGERFNILTEMTKAVINNDVRAMIVSGPPGVGKSFGVETLLEKENLFTQIQNRKPKYELVKGTASALGLYCTLYEHSDRGHVIVFDDCDSILMDELSLNILKGALDSGKSRRISWKAESHKLRAEGVPNSFTFNGSVIFITNLKFEAIRGKVRDHLAAIQSRCHYLDLTLDTDREKMLRIKQIADSGELFERYHFTKELQDSILSFMDENKDKLREICLRMAIKIADLVKVNPDTWQKLARCTVMK